MLLPDSVKTGFRAGPNNKGLNVGKKRSRTATMAKRQRKARNALKREETSESELDLSRQSYGGGAGAKAVIMNNRVMSATHDVTHKGVVSLYNNGFFPKRGGRVTKGSNFARISNGSKLYSTSGRYGVSDSGGFIASATP